MTKEWLRKTYMCPSNEQICWHALNGELNMVDAAELLVCKDEWEYILVEECPEIEILAKMISECQKNPQQRGAIEIKYRDAAMKAFFELLNVLAMPPAPEFAPPKKHSIARSAPL